MPTIGVRVSGSRSASAPKVALNANAAALLLSARDSGLDGGFSQPANALTFEIFARALVAHTAAYGTE